MLSHNIEEIPTVGFFRRYNLKTHAWSITIKQLVNLLSIVYDLICECMINRIKRRILTCFFQLRCKTFQAEKNRAEKGLFFDHSVSGQRYNK